MMKRLILGASIAVLATAATAAGHGAMGGKDLTREGAVAKVRDHFNKLDSNKDGSVTTDEMKSIRELRMAKRDDGHVHDKLIKRDPNAMFDKLDTNRDGSISRDEFIKGHELRIEKRIEIRESMKGAKGDHVMRAHHGGPGMHLMAMADQNKDNRITLSEAEATALKHFDEMDANRDGTVTAEERRAARPMMRVKMREMRKDAAPTAS